MLELLWHLKDELQMLLMGIFIALALWQGAAPERLCALIYSMMWLADQIYHAAFEKVTNAAGADVGHIVIDATVSIGLVGIALYANRNYTLWLASLQLVALFSHFLRAVSPAIDPTAYALLMASPMYLAVMVFAIGVGRHLRRSRKFGPYRSWRASLPRSSALVRPPFSQSA